MANQNKIDIKETMVKEIVYRDEDKAREILKQRAELLKISITEEEIKGAQLEVLEFKLANESYAIDSNYITSVISLKELTPLPCTPEFILGIIIIPIFWVFLYYLSGYYKDIYRKSRLKELAQTFFTILIGTTVIFFTSILDDQIVYYKQYYDLFGVLFLIQFSLTYIPRVTITSVTNYKIHSSKIGFDTILIGGNRKAIDIYKKIENQPKSVGNKFIGFISIFEKEKYLIRREDRC